AATISSPCSTRRNRYDLVYVSRHPDGTGDRCGGRFSVRPARHHSGAGQHPFASRAGCSSAGAGAPVAAVAAGASGAVGTAATAGTIRCRVGALAGTRKAPAGAAAVAGAKPRTDEKGFRSAVGEN